MLAVDRRRVAVVVVVVVVVVIVVVVVVVVDSRIKPDGVCMRSPEIQNCKFFNSRDVMAMATTVAATTAGGKYLRLTYTNIAGDEGCVFKNLHRYILIKVS